METSWTLIGIKDGNVVHFSEWEGEFSSELLLEELRIVSKKCDSFFLTNDLDKTEYDTNTRKLI